jgi:hypothetical protein
MTKKIATFLSMPPSRSFVSRICLHSGSADALNEVRSEMFCPPQRVLVLLAADSCVMLLLQ